MKVSITFFFYSFPFLMFLSGLSFAQNKLIINESFVNEITEGSVRLDEYISFLEDKENKLDIYKAASPEMQDKYIYQNKVAPNLGFNESAYWLRFKIVDSSGTIDNLLLINNYNSIEDITLYYTNESGEFAEFKSGLISGVSGKGVKTIDFIGDLPIKKNEESVFYLKIITSSPVIFSFSIISYQSYINNLKGLLFTDGLIFGILLLMISYNTFLYISIRENSYLFYVLYVTAYTIFLFLDKSYYSVFIGSIFYRDYYSIPIAALTSLGLFWLLLTRDYLATKKYFPLAYKILNILAIYAGVTILLVFFLPIKIAVMLFTINDLSFFIFGIVISLVTLKRGHKLSRFYIIALSGTVIGLFIIAARNAGILPLNYWTLNALQFGILWETIVLSYSLGYRMGDLEKRVQERTVELRTRTEELQNLSAHLQNIREQERKYIASEIHDEFGGMLSALKIDVLSLQDEQYSDVIGKKINTIVKFIDSSIKKVQMISMELRPEILDDLGLSDAMDWYCEEFEKRTGIKCIFSGDETAHTNINDGLALDLFRIFQESLTNILRHSKADEIHTSLVITSDEILISVKDNGVGILQEKINDPKSIGLIGMRERINKWCGTFSITGSDGSGTTIKIKVAHDKSNYSG